MTQIEQIKAEIERLTEVTGYALSEYENGRRSAMYDIRKQLTEYINSLPAEQPSEELEKASYHAAMELMNNPNFTPKTIFGQFISMLQDLFKDGAQWQKEQLINKACEWLVYNVNGSVYYDDFDNAFVDTDELITVFKEAMEDEQ